MRKALTSPAVTAPAIMALVLWGAVPVAAFAQATTGTGGGPASTITAPNTAATGRTMPPSRGEGGATAEDRERRTPEQKVDDKITSGICIGCGPK